MDLIDKITSLEQVRARLERELAESQQRVRALETELERYKLQLRQAGR